MNQYSLQAYEELDSIHCNRLYQQILGVLSDDIPRTREQLEFETGIKGNTLRPRIKELMSRGYLNVQGEGRTKSKRKAEKIGIHLID